MDRDVEFRVIFILLGSMISLIQYIYRRPSRDASLEKKRIGQVAGDYVRPAVMLWLASLVLYSVGFPWTNIFVPLPHWVRWSGVAGMMLVPPLSVWVYRSLGVQFSPKLQLLVDHTLVSAGPYRFVRHPMYATLFLCALAASLVSANLMVMVASGILVIAVTARIEKEEAMLLERFGEQYRGYMRSTGSIVPKYRLRDLIHYITWN